jgi:hypothetical protein
VGEVSPCYERTPKGRGRLRESCDGEGADPKETFRVSDDGEHLLQIRSGNFGRPVCICIRLDGWQEGTAVLDKHRECRNMEGPLFSWKFPNPKEM